MALNFNPFEKDKAASTPKTKNNHSHYRVFDDPTQQNASSDQASEPSPTLAPTEPKTEETKPKTDHKQITNGLQTDHKQVIVNPGNRLQTDHKQTTDKAKRATEQTTEEITSRLQTDHKQTTNCDISALVGHERNLLLFIFNECRVTGELATAPLTLFRIKEELKISSSSAAKTIIARLIAKGFFLRGKAKTGRGGWMTFRLKRETFQRLLLETDYKRITNGLQTDDKETTKRATQRTTDASSSSSSFLVLDIKKTTTTSEGGTTLESNASLSPNWATVDPSPLESIRFTETHLTQLASRGRRSPKEVQDSIYAFAFDLEVNGKGKELRSPLNFFMKILHDGPYAPPENYESPTVRQRRLYLESQERELRKLKEIEDKIEALEFEKWAKRLSLEKRVELVPPNDFAKPGGTAHMMQLREYFRENVLPALKECSNNGDNNAV